MKKWLLILTSLLLLSIGQAFSQRAGIKTNAVYWATATANIGIEFKLGKKTTFDLSGNYNPWTFSGNKKWKHWLVQPELRYWLCENFNGHFFGIHFLGGELNAGNINLPFKLLPGLKHQRYEGAYYGGGITYGYQWLLSKHLNLETCIGGGYIRANYNRYNCPKCGEWQYKGHKNYWGVTKIALSLIYFIK